MSMTELCSRDSSCTALGSPFSCYPPPGDRTANWLHQTSYIHCRRADKPRLGICMWLTKASMAFAGNAIEAFVSHRSEEHTSELQSRQYLVCRLLLEKKKKKKKLKIMIQ